MCLCACCCLVSVVSARRCVAVSLRCCVAVLLCIGRSLWLSAAVVAQQPWRCAGVGGAAASVVLSRDTSGCSCIFVALPLPSDAVLACVCVCVDARDARGCAPSLRLGCQMSSCSFLHVCPRSIHSLFAVAVLLLLLLLWLLLLWLCAERLFACAWYRCLSRCNVRDRRSVAALSSGMTVSGTCGLSSLAHGVVRER